METVRGKLVAKETDTSGYTTYVFEITDSDDSKRVSSKYVMCVRFPNWEHAKISLGEDGYLAYQEIRAGEDKWFNGTEYIPYRYNMVQFLKFIPYKEPVKHEYRL